MRPKTPETIEQPDMFRETLEAILNPRHELLVLARQIDWERIDEVCGETFVPDVGRPGLPTRLMAGLHILKHMRGVSDEVLTEGWVENGYWQAFCGERFFQHEAPFDRSSMTRWRQRMGAERLGALARRHGVALRQSFARVAHRARRQASRLLYSRGHKQGLRHLRKLRTYLGRLIRDIGRKIAGDPALEAAFATPLERAQRIHDQQPGDADKLYAFHAPEVECIGKGEARPAPPARASGGRSREPNARSRYEFGVKTSIATTNARCAGGQFVLGALTLPGNPYDRHSLARQLDQVERLLGRPVRRAYVDRGYRGHGVRRDGLDVVVSHTRGIASPTVRREMRRRNAIEPFACSLEPVAFAGSLGHMKEDGLLDRNHLAGPEGDAINAILCAAGHNFRLLLAWFRALLALIILIALYGRRPSHASGQATA